MSDFVYLFRTTVAGRREAMGTPEKAQRSMQAWLAWMRDLEAKGHLKERGQPLDNDGKVIRGRDRVYSDGPFIEVKDLVAGYIVVTAKDLAEATELSKGCPILEGDGSVEVRPIMIMNM
jgi:hypothetical protein